MTEAGDRGRTGGGRGNAASLHPESGRAAEPPVTFRGLGMCRERAKKPLPHLAEAPWHLLGHVEGGLAPIPPGDTRQLGRRPLEVSLPCLEGPPGRGRRARWVSWCFPAAAGTEDPLWISKEDRPTFGRAGGETRTEEKRLRPQPPGSGGGGVRS